MPSPTRSSSVSLSVCSLSRGANSRRQTEVVSARSDLCQHDLLGEGLRGPQSVYCRSHWVSITSCVPVVADVPHSSGATPGTHTQCRLPVSVLTASAHLVLACYAYIPASILWYCDDVWDLTCENFLVRLILDLQCRHVKKEK